MTTLRLSRPQGFSLRAARDFYMGFVPGSGMAAASADTLTLALLLDGSFEPVAARLAEVDDAIVVDFSGTSDSGALARQLSRMLGLEADGKAWWDVGRRDPVVGDLQREFPGFFTAAKASPYDAAAWGVIAAGLGIASAARLKTAIAGAHGDVVEVGGFRGSVFPSPRAILDLEAVTGLPREKVARLKGVARGALEGRLEAERLRAMGEHAAVEELRTFRGVGPWTASHVYYRGAAPPDGLPLAEPRVLRGFSAAYGMPPSEEAFRTAAEKWRPFRMWVCVLLARHLKRGGAWSSRLRIPPLDVDVREAE